MATRSLSKNQGRRIGGKVRYNHVTTCTGFGSPSDVPLHLDLGGTRPVRESEPPSSSARRVRSVPSIHRIIPVEASRPGSVY